jgi:hypothetical protein
LHGNRQWNRGGAGGRRRLGGCLGNKLFRLRHLVFLDDVGLRRLSLRLPGGFGLLAQNFFRKRIGHVDDGGIHLFLVGPQGEQVRRNSHHNVHQGQVDRGLEIARDRIGRLKIACRKMGNQILQENFHFARRELAQDHVHRQADLGCRGAGRFKFG